jgi:hypothetical protein
MPSATSNAPGETRLRGPRRWLARIVWAVLMFISIQSIVTEMPDYLGRIEHGTAATTGYTQQAVAALSSVGLTLRSYETLNFGVVILVSAVSVIIAILLFWRRSDDWMALLVSVFIVNYISVNITPPGSPMSPEPNNVIVTVIVAILITTQYLITFAVYLLFPNGRFAPRWSWLVVIAAGVWGAVVAIIGQSGDPGLLFLFYPLFIIFVVVALIYRYRKVSTPIERLQTKWVIAGFVAPLIANQLFWLPTTYTPLGESLYPPLAFLFYQLTLMLLPIAFFVAIQRYHLYNIDAIINRALVYGSLTAILAALYGACVFGAQAAVGALTRTSQENQPLIIVATTLLVAVLVHPVRRALQAFIDRRFYRRKYDAAQTLAAFGATLRAETELVRLSEHLLAAVGDTMQPEHVALWLREPAPLDMKNGE